MSMLENRPRGWWPAAAALSVLMLSGCALIGGGSKPADLYSFGSSPARTSATSVAARSITILYAGAAMGSQSSGTRILTEDGNQVAYIAEARWAAPAAELFDAATVRKLEGASSVKVVRPGGRAKADYQLAIDVVRFAAVYSAGPGAPPDAVIEARAKLVRITDRTIVGDWPIEERVPAGENRVLAIVAALDRSTDAATTKIAGLTNQAAAGGLSD